MGRMSREPPFTARRMTADVRVRTLRSGMGTDDHDSYPQDPEVRLTEAQLAKMLSVSVRHLRRLRKRAAGPPYERLGERLVRYRLGDVQVWLGERRIDPRPRDPQD